MRQIPGLVILVVPRRADLPNAFLATMVYSTPAGIFFALPSSAQSHAKGIPPRVRVMTFLLQYPAGLGKVLCCQSCSSCLGAARPRSYAVCNTRPGWGISFPRMRESMQARRGTALLLHPAARLPLSGLGPIHWG